MNKSVITKVELQKKNKDRVNVYVDEEFAFACSTELVYSYDIRRGKNVDVDYIKNIVNEDNYIKAKKYALNVVEKAYKTEKEIRDKLEVKEYDENTINRVLGFLKEYKFVDDDKYCKIYIEEKIKKQGKSKIKYSLMKKGISESLIDDNLNFIDEEIESDSARKLAIKKYEILLKESSSIKSIYNKLGNYLLRNGYDYNIVNKILIEVVNKDDLCNEKSDEKLKELIYNKYKKIAETEKDNKKVYMKLTNYFLRKGYEWEKIKSLLYAIIEM